MQKKTASMSFLDLSPALLIPLMIFGSAAVLLLALYLAKPKPFLDGTRQSLKLAEIKVLSPDTKLFRFALPSEKHCFGLPLGKHVKIFCPNPTGVVAGKWNGRDDPEEGADEIRVVVDGLKSHGAMCKVVVRQRGVGLEG